MFVNPLFLDWLRQYPRGYAENVRRAYERHLTTSAPGRRDLRFKPQTCGANISEVEMFRNIPLGDDPWEEANLLPCLSYMMESKHVRWAPYCLMFNLFTRGFIFGRIPTHWVAAMKEFHSAYQKQAPPAPNPFQIYYLLFGQVLGQ